jgi:hypothetical protein
VKPPVPVKAPAKPAVPKGKTPKAPKAPKGKSPIKGGPKGLGPILVVIGVIALVVGFFIIRSHHKAKGPHPHSVSVFKLVPGDCLVQPTTIKAELATLQVVPCSLAHTEEVFATTTYQTSTGAYPGDAALQTFAQGSCLQQFKPYVGVAYEDSGLFFTFLLPSARSWTDVTDRTVTCVITTTGQQLTKSVKGSRM